MPHRSAALSVLCLCALLLPLAPASGATAGAPIEVAPTSGAIAQDSHHESPEFRFYPDAVEYDPAIPTLEEVVGHGSGDRITSPSEIEQYLKALAAASPRVRFEPYGETWEGRTLSVAIIASEDNHRRLEEIREAVHLLADPRVTDEAAAGELIADLPVITWLAANVHGNEPSSSDAVLLLAHHLAAALDDALADEVLANSVVIIDPTQNPDGRDRFVTYFRQTTGRWPDADSLAAELSAPWPGGRTNHYLFDLNRDWFAQTQLESRGKVKVFRRWRPQVFIDLHEMGTDSTYYFPPQADPRNPDQTLEIMGWLGEIGRNNARWFDRMRFDYFNREVFDSFYPGYGASWPMYQGAVGATYEQASSRGLLHERGDGTVLPYRRTVQGHFIASIATVETAARNREGLLRHFWEHHRDAIAEGERADLREVILVPGDDPNRTASLVGLLMSQGIEVAQATEGFRNEAARDYFGGPAEDRDFPAGTYRVAMAQPRMHLARTLLAPQVDMEADFIAEQLRRYSLREGDQIYDITGWSLPLMFGVEAYTAGRPSSGAAALLESAPELSGGVHGDAAALAYLVPWGTHGAAEALSAMHRHGIRVHVADKELSIGGRDYPAGSLIVKVEGNPDDLHAQLETIAEHHHADFYPTDTSWVDGGINFGSGQVRFVPKARVALAWDQPTSSYSAGWARYVLERSFNVAVTIVRTESLGRADLSDFNVIVLPSAGGFGGGADAYTGALGEAGIDNLKRWISGGGTLVALDRATGWLASEDVGLLSTSRRLKENSDDQENDGAGDAATGDTDAEGLIPASWIPDEEEPASIPGAILRVVFDGDHWVGFGMDGGATVLANNRDYFDPLTIDTGSNVAVFAGADEVLASGFIWDAERELIADTPFVMVQPHGAGNVVAFTQDPNFRAFQRGMSLPLLNAVLFGPAH